MPSREPLASRVGPDADRVRRPIPAYVLGLTDGFRGEELLAQLSAHGLAAQHVPALDAAMLLPGQLAAIYDADAARWIERPLAPAEAACALGHLTMMRRFLGTDSEWALFLEDDATLLRDPMPLLAALADVSAAPLVVHLTSEAGVGACTPAADSCRIRVVGAPLDGTVGYAANRALARMATEAYRDHRIDSTADWPIRWRYEARFAVCEPPFIKHSGSQSSIESDRILAQAAGILDRRSRLTRLVGTLCGPRLLAARRHGYPMALAFRHNVIEPLARVARRRSWRRRGD